MILQDDLLLEITKAICVAAWLMFFLILKNIILLILLTIDGRKRGIYYIPEDINTFSGGSGHQPIDTTDEWTLSARIQKILANDTEYMPYFFILFIIIFCTIPLTSRSTHYYLARALGYGLVFTVARYLHTISYLIRNTYGRILGFLLSVLILIIMSFDHIVFMTKRLNDYIP